MQRTPSETGRLHSPELTPRELRYCLFCLTARKVWAVAAELTLYDRRTGEIFDHQGEISQLIIKLQDLIAEKEGRP